MWHAYSGQTRHHQDSSQKKIDKENAEKITEASDYSVVFYLFYLKSRYSHNAYLTHLGGGGKEDKPMP